MLKLIKNVQVYAPEFRGKNDIFVASGKIVAIEPEINLPQITPHLEIIDGEGLLAAPGFIDAHVHIIGGGGEGGFHTRTPELSLTDATTSGVTTVIGVIGTDGTTRQMPDLIAKARGLEEEGITCFVHTGSYQIPVKTLTGKIEDDILLIDRIIGVGEIAISDHRSSQPTVQELAKIGSAARIGGMLSGKGGIVNLHVGDGNDRLELLNEVVQTTSLPRTQFYPTHLNRNEDLFQEAIKHASQGGYVDFTTSTIQRFLDQGEVKCSQALKRMIKAGVSVEQITFTSDAQGSLPEFDDEGHFAGLGIGRIQSLYREWRDCIIEEKIEITEALKVVTENPARILKLPEKGQLAKGFDADIVLFTPDDLTIHTVFAKGIKMVGNQEVLVKGTFET